MSRTEPDIVLLAHGSPDARHARGIARLADRVQELVGTRPVHAAYLDHHGPTPEEVAARVAGAAVAVPVLVTPAHHARVDVPRAVAVMDAGCPRGCRAALPLGPDAALLDGVEELLGAAGVVPDAGTAVVLYAAGSSDGAALRSVQETVAASPRERWGPWRVAALSGGQSLAEVVAALPRGARRPVAVAYMAADGLLRDRMADACAGRGVTLVPGTLSDADAVARLVVTRAGSLTP